MSVIENGELAQTSVSQSESFDHQQKGGCQRKWWFNVPIGLRQEEMTRAQSDGDKGHHLLEQYFRTGHPPGRTRMSKAVNGVIVKGDLPAIGDDLLIEHRLSEQEKFDENGNWIPLDRSSAFYHGGLPWDGFIDLAFRRANWKTPGLDMTAVPTVLDHKFTASMEYAKTPEQLIKTIQLPLYVLSQMPYWPDAKQWEIAHHYVAKTGVESKIVRAVVSVDQILERGAAIAQVVNEMREIARVPIDRQDDVPVTPTLRSLSGSACDLYGGCPHQSVCNAFKRRQEKPTVQLTPEEEALFGPAPTAPAAVAPPPPAQVTLTESGIAAKAPIPDSVTLEPRGPCAACGEPLNSGNSAAQGAGLKHFGCKATIAAAPAVITPPDVPASRPELASEQPKQPAEPKQRKPKAPAPAVVSDSAPVATQTPAPAPIAPSAPRVEFSPEAVTAALGARSNTVADLLESIARLLRS